MSQRFGSGFGHAASTRKVGTRSREEGPCAPDCTPAVRLRHAAIRENDLKMCNSVSGDLLDRFQQVLALSQNHFFQLGGVRHRRVHRTHPCNRRVQVIE